MLAPMEVVVSTEEAGGSLPFNSAEARLQDIDTVLGAEYAQAALLLDGTVVALLEKEA